MDKSGRQLLAWIKSGRGQGHGSNYQSWLRITRRGQPSGGNLSKPYLPVLGRSANFLSGNEANLATWLLWLGVSDLREQFPLWPHAHVHPVYGHPLANHHALPWSRGTLEIARNLGIRHGTFVGTRIPYVATTDFMLTIIDRGAARLIAVAAKPAGIVNGTVKVSLRAKERLLLEKEYSRELGIPWQVMSDEKISPALRENLEFSLKASKLPDAISGTLLRDFCGQLVDRLRHGETIEAARSKAKQACSLAATTADGLFYYGLWTRAIPIDLREKLVMSRPAKLTDFSWAHREAAHLFGGQDHE
jgi:hypothetical protein